MIYPNQLLCSYHPHPNPPFPTAELRLRCMKSIGNRCISFFTRTCVVNRTSRKLIKASTHVPFPRKATWTINSVRKGSWFRIPARFSRESRIPSFCHPAIPNSVFFPHSVPYPNLGEFHSGSSQIPYPVDISRIPHFNSAQPLIPGLPLHKLNQYWLFR